MSVPWVKWSSLHKGFMIILIVNINISEMQIIKINDNHYRSKAHRSTKNRTLFSYPIRFLISLFSFLLLFELISFFFLFRFALLNIRLLICFISINNCKVIHFQMISLNWQLYLTGWQSNLTINAQFYL